MRTLVSPESLAGVARVLASSAEAVDDAVAGVHGPATMAAAATTGLRLTVEDPAVAGPCATLVRAVERHVLAALASGAVEEANLRAMAVALRRVAGWYAAAEDGVADALKALDTAVHAHPDTLERVAGLGHRFALDGLLAGGERLGWLHERRDRVVAVRGHAPVTVPPPTGLGDLVAGDVAVERTDGLVRVTEVVGADGASVWVVAISGTQSWTPAPGDNPFDVTADVHAVRAEATAAAIGVHLALLDAQRATGRDTSAEPVLLSGHSLGGILAAGLAADPSFRHGRTVTAVVTAGSPTGRLAVPASVGTVAIEHRSDPVPRLDGVPGRTDRSWSTLVVDVPEGVTQGRGSAAHAGGLYARSAREIEAQARTDGVVESWEEVVAPFTEGPGRRAVARDYVLTREWQNPRS